VGFKACQNELQSYNDAVTGVLNQVLMTLQPVSKDMTRAIVEYLKEKWYTYSDDINSGPYEPKNSKTAGVFPDIYLKILRRHCRTGLNIDPIDHPNPDLFVAPWLIQDVDRLLTSEIREALGGNTLSKASVTIDLPTVDENNKDLKQYFTFEIQNAANKDDTLFSDLLVNGTLDSTHFGLIAGRLRNKYAETDIFVDDPSMMH
jgi:hypothetical protein